ARAILRVFDAIHKGNPDSKLLAYQYLQMLPQIAEGESNKMWIVPTELTQALQGIGAALGSQPPTDPGLLDGPPGASQTGDEEDPVEVDEPSLEDPSEALRRAREDAAGAAKEAEESTRTVRRRGVSEQPGPVSPPEGMPTGPPPVSEPERPDEPTQ